VRKAKGSGARPRPPRADRVRMSGVRGRFNAACLLVVTAAPAAIVASFELLGTRRTADMLAKNEGSVGDRS
jgi:hypothetical protein